MINPKCWRTPVPVDIHTCESIDPLSRMLFFEILTLCQNKEHNKSFYHWNKFINITLKRWECVFVVSKYSKCLGVCNRRIKKSLENLSKWYNETQIESKAFWLIIKLKNYDEIIEMQNETQIESKSKAKRKQKQKQDCKEWEDWKDNFAVPANNVFNIESIQNHLKPIYLYWCVKGIRFKNNSVLWEGIKRDVKNWKFLSENYTLEEIAKTMIYCAEKFPDWKLEAVRKNIAEAINLEWENPVKGKISDRVNNLLLAFKSFNPLWQ